MRSKLISFLLVMLVFSACTIVEEQTKEEPTNSINPNQIESAEERKSFNEIKGNSCELLLDTDILINAKKGHLKGIKANLNSSKSNLEELYGKPDKVGFNNAEYLIYDNCYFYIWDENKIGVIDIKINFSVEKVKEVLGNPDFEGNPDAGYDEYVLGYKAEEFYLYFKYQNKDSTSGVFRFKKL